MNDFMNNLVTLETKKQIIVKAQTSSSTEFYDFMCRLRSECKLNAYAENRRPLRIDDDECLKIISQSVYRHFSQSQNVTVDTLKND